MEVQVLLPEPAPEQITDRTVIQSLGEHFQAFLNANNINGFPKEPHYVLSEDRIADLLLIIASKPGITVSDAKQYGKKIRALSGSEVPLTACYQMAARALGYHTWDLLIQCVTVGDFIINVWPYNQKADVREALSPFGEHDKQTVSDLMRNPKARELLWANRDLNALRKQNKERSLKRMKKIRSGGKKTTEVCHLDN